MSTKSIPNYVLSQVISGFVLSIVRYKNWYCIQWKKVEFFFTPFMMLVILNAVMFDGVQKLIKRRSTLCIPEVWIKAHHAENESTKSCQNIENQFSVIKYQSKKSIKERQKHNEAAAGDEHSVLQHKCSHGSWKNNVLLWIPSPARVQAVCDSQ